MRPDTIELSSQSEKFKQLAKDLQGQKMDRYLIIFANYKPSKSGDKLLNPDEEKDFKRLLKLIIEFNESYKEKRRLRL